MTVVFVYLLHISSLDFAVVYFAFACAPCRGFVVAFLAFFIVVFKTFCCRFSIFQEFQYYLLYIYITPTWYISTLAFDNFLRFSIQRLSYSSLFMSTTVCSSACRRYEPLIVIVVIYFAVFGYYMYWLICIGSDLHVLVSFYPSLLCLYTFCIFLILYALQVLQQFILPLYAHPVEDFSEVLQQYFQHYLQQFLRHFVADFLYFRSSNIICYTYVLYPHGIYLLLIAI